MRISASSVLPPTAATSTDNLRPSQQAEVSSDRDKAQSIEAESSAAETRHSDDAVASRQRNEAKVDEAKAQSRQDAFTPAEQAARAAHHQRAQGVGFRLNARA